MNSSRPCLRTFGLFAVATLVPVLAQAHPGHEHGDFGGGATHPLLGLDHLLAAVAIGVWAAQLGGRARWMVPFTFIAALALGAVASLSGLQVAIAEPGVLGSVFLLGLLIVAAVRLPLAVSASLAAVFALCHGYAHASEIPSGAGVLSYSAGLLVTTALLHLAGIVVALRAQTFGPRWVRVAGAVVLAAGVLALG